MPLFEDDPQEKDGQRELQENGCADVKGYLERDVLSTVSLYLFDQLEGQQYLQKLIQGCDLEEFLVKLRPGYDNQNRTL